MAGMAPDPRLAVLTAPRHWLCLKKSIPMALEGTDSYF